mmetsp:Transcript_12225/g.16597  ORF Transcript_12225/g.16597 Transcript_12225/m.16597 type:complete len:123 (+) Transcript_12225:240-608(+)
MRGSALDIKLYLDDVFQDTTESEIIASPQTPIDKLDVESESEEFIVIIRTAGKSSQEDAPTLRKTSRLETFRMSTATEETFLAAYKGPDSKKIVHVIPTKRLNKESFKQIRRSLKAVDITPK